MAEQTSHSVTQLLLAWRQGDPAALEQLVPLVYQKLRRLARRYMAGQRPGHTLQATGLVNEAYFRLIDCQQVNWKDRAHFFAISAQLMRRVLVEFARSARYQKRGGGARKTSLDEGLIVSSQRGQDLVAIDDALQAFASSFPRQSRVVELRFFGGLSVEETAEVLQVSAITVMRDWQLAKSWLARELKKGDRYAGRTIGAN
ncbi:MAG: RNA polymerase subunit sigma-70 [Cyanobacteria bacterium 13_1_40CM_2_61_4]|nr:MAG: RNA polymerase subunit sigma-70 [Cyanobacteria bacterium 13_1_40CM_2_61_4]